MVSRDLGLNPGSLADVDLRRILSGAISVIDGLGSLRTHEGSAHGRGTKRYRVEPRHARLAINAAHTRATFVLETWDARRSRT
ncbi:MAG: abortive infection family protein [Candidatus Binataceae bacterium]